MANLHKQKNIHRKSTCDSTKRSICHATITAAIGKLIIIMVNLLSLETFLELDRKFISSGRVGLSDERVMKGEQTFGKIFKFQNFSKKKLFWN